MRAPRLRSETPSPGRTPPRKALRAALPSVAGWLAVGLVLAAAWRLLVPVARGWAEGYERDLSGDITLAVIELVMGTVAAVLGLLQVGPGSSRRFTVALVGSFASSLVAWGVGRLLGAPALTVTVVLLVAPLAVSLVTVVGTLVATLALRDPYAD